MKPDVPPAPTNGATCFYCGKIIPDQNWFARIPHNSQRVLFCRPRCVELFLEETKEAAPAWSPAERSE